MQGIIFIKIKDTVAPKYKHIFQFIEEYYGDSVIDGSKRTSFYRLIQMFCGKDKYNNALPSYDLQSCKQARCNEKMLSKIASFKK